MDAAVAVEDVDTGDDAAASRVAVEVLVCDCSAGLVGVGTSGGSVVGFEGLPSVMGLQTPELSSGHRKTSTGPRVLLSDTW